MCHVKNRDRNCRLVHQSFRGRLKYQIHYGRVHQTKESHRKVELDNRKTQNRAWGYYPDVQKQNQRVSKIAQKNIQRSCWTFEIRGKWQRRDDIAYENRSWSAKKRFVLS